MAALAAISGDFFQYLVFDRGSRRIDNFGPTKKNAGTHFASPLFSLLLCAYYRQRAMCGVPFRSRIKRKPLVLSATTMKKADGTYAQHRQRQRFGDVGLDLYVD